ncbi:MAG: hypothetical protein R6T92_07050 [Desulfosalsimonadaceae bacterium]
MEKAGKKRGVMIGGVLLVFCIALVSCARHVQRDHFIQADAAHRMLIASSASEFKDALRSRLIDNYRPVANIEVIDIKLLEEIDADAFDAIVIMDSCWARSHLNLSFKRFIDDLERRNHVILLLTTGGEEWDFAYENVDAVTSASVIDNQDKVFETLRRRIDAVLMKKQAATSKQRTWQARWGTKKM